MLIPRCGSLNMCRGKITVICRCRWYTHRFGLNAIDGDARPVQLAGWCAVYRERNDRWRQWKYLAMHRTVPTNTFNVAKYRKFHNLSASLLITWFPYKPVFVVTQYERSDEWRPKSWFGKEWKRMVNGWWCWMKHVNGLNLEFVVRRWGVVLGKMKWREERKEEDIEGHLATAYIFILFRWKF